MLHWFAHWMGLDDASGPVYLFWSGFAGDLPMLGAMLLIYRKINCHAKGCHRIALHRVDGTHFVTCRKHHPDHVGDEPATAEQIAQACQEAKQ